jgi:cytoskeletal protein CcmA (bactofilin family)
MKTENPHPNFCSDNYNDNTDRLNSGKGDLSFKGNLKISGIFSGKLNVSGTLTVAINACVTGDVIVSDLIVLGTLVGTVRVNNMAVFRPSASFSGTLTANEAEFHRGSRVNGTRIIGLITEKGFNKDNTESRLSAPSQESIPDEMTHSMFRL